MVKFGPKVKASARIVTSSDTLANFTGRMKHLGTN